MSSDDSYWVPCAVCGGSSRNHRVLFTETKRDFYDPEYSGDYEGSIHRLVQCKACESLRYVATENASFESGEFGRKIYPDDPAATYGRKPAITIAEATGDDGELLIPETVWKMYQETTSALVAGIRTLAAGGLRATVEAICIDCQIEDRNLQKKIDALAASGKLTKSQADLLHEERYLGNAALHEMEPPSAQDIEDGLGIVDGLISTLYILPAKAERLRQRRENKAAGGQAGE